MDVDKSVEAEQVCESAEVEQIESAKVQVIKFAKVEQAEVYIVRLSVPALCNFGTM